MKKKDWLYVLVPLLVVWLLDRITKNLAFHISSLQFYGPFGLVFHENHGAMLGLFSNLPLVLRIVTLSTGGAFLLFSYAIIQYLLPVRSLLLRSGMSILLGGILGNVTDRIIWGYVVDFLLIGNRDLLSPAFNLADAFQWIGYAMLVTALVREGEILWPTQNSRVLYWVNPRFQLKYCITLMGVGFAFSIIAGVFSYTYLRVTIIDLVGNQPRILDQFLIPFVLTFAVVSIAFSAMLFLFGRSLSQRIAGPLYAFERFMKDLLSGNPRPLRIRAGDEFKELETLAQKIAEEMLRERQRNSTPPPQAANQD